MADQPNQLDPERTARRLKAARWIIGMGEHNEKGQLVPLDPKKIAQAPVMKDNGLTANAIGELERMTRTPRPMELRAIAEAMELPYEFFSEPEWFREIDPLTSVRDALERLAAAAGLPPGSVPGQQTEGHREGDRPDEAAEGGG